MIGAIIGGIAGIGATAYGIGSAIASNPLKALKWASKNHMVGTAIKAGWDRRQTNTGYQRAMHDMRKAGLNPLLAGKYGPAPSATMEGLGSVSNTAKQVDINEKKATQEINNLKEQFKSIKAENVRKEVIAEYFKTPEGKELAKTLAINGSPLNPITALTAWITNTGGQVSNNVYSKLLDGTQYGIEVMNGVMRIVELKARDVKDKFEILKDQYYDEN